MVVHMEIKLVIGVKQIKIKDMKFKVINEENDKIMAMNLDIHEARKIARAHNTEHKSDIFTISSQLEVNMERLLNVKSIKWMIKQYPNDADLGAEIRKLYK